MGQKNTDSEEKETRLRQVMSNFAGDPLGCAEQIHNKPRIKNPGTPVQ